MSRTTRPVPTIHPIAVICGTACGGTIGSSFARLGVSPPNSDVTFTSSGSVSIKDGSPGRSEFGRLSTNAIEIDRIRCLPACAGSN